MKPRHTKPGRQTMVPQVIQRTERVETDTRSQDEQAAALAQGVVLVVENRTGEREACSQLLEREGYEVLRAATCEEGMALARERQPNLVVVEAAMPDGSGKELALQLKLLSALARVPVVGIGMVALPKGKNHPFAAYLTTPCDGEEFRRTVRKLMGRRITREVDARRDRPMRVKS